MYAPAGVLGGTDTVPVDGSSAGTGAPTVAGVAGIRTVPVILVSVTGTPFNLSLA